MDQSRSMDLQRPNTDLRRRTSSLVATPARSADLIMEESPEASPLAGSRVSAAPTEAEVSTAVAAEAFTVAAAVMAEVTGNPVSS
jgi:hypothetical protein